MSNKKIIGIDPGIYGGLSNGSEHIKTPLKRVIDKKPVFILDKDKSGKKQYYKTGPKAGQLKYKVKTPEKFHFELDMGKIIEFIKDSKIVVLEVPGLTRGNMAKATRTTMINFGILKALSELNAEKVIYVSPQHWKKDLRLSADKLEAIEMAEKETDTSFRTSRGALLDGPAEGFLLRKWYLEKWNISI